jgi:Trk K+ transport system NAD-binding subunit
MLDRDAALVEQAREEGLSAEHIDYTDDDALRAVGIGGSDIEGVFCLLREDSENVFLAISARAIARACASSPSARRRRPPPSCWPPAPTRWSIPTKSAAPACTN